MDRDYRPAEWGGARVNDQRWGRWLLIVASLSLILLYLLAYEVIRDIGVALCATVTFSVNAWLLRWAGSGMETSLAVLLVLAVFLFCLRNEYFLSIVFAALLA